MTFTLTRDERKAVARGDTTALKRKETPDVKGGEVIVLARSRGGRQFVGRTVAEREANRGATVDIPTVPTLWVVLKPPQLKDGRWVVAFTRHDTRQPTRRLAAAPNPPTEAGLRTRSGESVDPEGIAHPRKVPEKGADVRPLTDEAARGYGGGTSAIDDCEAVDDATLHHYARLVAEENRMKRSHQRDVAAGIRAEEEVAKQRRRGKPGTLALAASQRASKKLRAAA